MTDQNQKTVSSSGAAWQFFWDLAKVFLIAFGLVSLVIRPYIGEPFIVSGASMVPNFHNRDYLVVQKLSYKKHSPERGDVIVFRYPNDPKQYFIKRIIGIPGDSVRISQNHVYLQKTGSGAEEILKEDYIPKDFETAAGGVSQWKLGPDQYFVLGDNREHSSDSRFWGVLPGSFIVGKVWLRVLPVGDAGLIEHASFK